MAVSSPLRAPETTLVLRRTFPVPRERVFRAWTELALIKQWFGPEEHTIPEAEVDARVGGKYRIAMRSKEGQVYRVKGVYREIAPPERLVFTWSWEGEEEQETLVTVELHAQGDGTELVLTHERFPNAEVRDRHGWGWNSSFNKLAKALQ
ncbi:MAG: SRPBCC domain-containing protein [Candidatus Lambdaproteobacteria bacterium]|nr:SRPBCC domain-containing protein [Candidatus Lambdaproteobacteria bacterium]